MKAENSMMLIHDVDDDAHDGEDTDDDDDDDGDDDGTKRRRTTKTPSVEYKVLVARYHFSG